MLVVMVRIPVGSEDEGEALANRFRNRAGLVDSQPGFISFELLKGDAEYISVTRWKDRESLDTWMRSQAHEQAHARPAHAPSGGESHSSGHGSSSGGSVSMYEVVIPGK